MRRARGLLAVLAIALLAPSAHAAEIEAIGWWWRAQTGLVVGLPVPPTAPPGGLVVSAAPDGATGVGAVRFSLAADERPVSLRFEVDRSIGTAAVRACPATLLWMPVEAGAWEARPTVDCDRASAAGVPAEDGSHWTFDVTGFDSDAVLDVVLVPDVPEGGVRPDAFEIGFTAPSPNAVTLAATPVAVPTNPGVSPSSPPTPFRPEPPPPPGRFLPPPPAPAATSPDEPVVAQPTAGPVEEPSPSQGAPVAAPKGDVDPRDAATAAASVLLATAALLWFLRRPEPDAIEAGLARWRRPRDGRPPPLL